MTQGRKPSGNPSGGQFSSKRHAAGDVSLQPHGSPGGGGQPGSKRHLIHDPLALSGAEVRLLLEDLDERLKSRGVAASLYLVGGAALVMNNITDGMTPDIDGWSDQAAVFEEAQRMADEYGLKQDWLNQNAKPWVPPRPESARTAPSAPGLRIVTAPDEHLLAMKMVASRPKDRPHLQALIRRLDVQTQPESFYVDLLYEVYSGEDQLADILGVPGSDPDLTRAEAEAIAKRMVRLARSCTAGESTAGP